MFDPLTFLPWWGYALLFSLIWPVNNEANRHFQVDGHVLIIWRSFFGALFLFPLALFVPWPDSPYFYLFEVLSALLLSYQECEAFKFSKNYGGLFLSLQSVLWILTATILWWTINPEYLAALPAHPLSAAFILGGFLLGIAAQFFLRSGKLPGYTKDLNKILLMAVMGGTAVTFVKLGMSYTQTVISVFVWSMLNNALISGFNAVRYAMAYKKEKLPSLFEIKSVKAGAFMGFVIALAAPMIVLSFAAAPNPGFSNLVSQLSVLWLFLYCRWKHRPTNVHIFGLCLTVAGTIFLIAGTSLAH